MSNRIDNVGPDIIEAYRAGAQAGTEQLADPMTAFEMAAGDDGDIRVDDRDNPIMGQKITTDKLAKAGEGPFKDIPKFMAEELAEAYSQYGIEAGDYDLLDDETGLVTGKMEDFETAYAVEQLNSDLNSDYNPSLLKENGIFAGETIYKYDSDGDGTFETKVTFDRNGDQVSHELFDEEGKVAGIKTSVMDFYDVRTKDGNHPIYNDDIDSMFIGGEDGVQNQYKFTYNADGTVKTVSVSQYDDPHESTGCPPTPNDEYPVPNSETPLTSECPPNPPITIVPENDN